MQSRAISSHPFISDMAEETSPHLTTTFFQEVCNRFFFCALQMLKQIEQPGLAEGAPANGRTLELDDPKGFFELIPFYDSMIIITWKRPE